MSPSHTMLKGFVHIFGHHMEISTKQELLPSLAYLYLLHKHPGRWETALAVKHFLKTNSSGAVAPCTFYEKHYLKFSRGKFDDFEGMSWYLHTIGQFPHTIDATSVQKQCTSQRIVNLRHVIFTSKGCNRM